MLGEIFLERGANLQSQAAHTHPRDTQVPPPGDQPHWIRYVQQPSLRDVTPGCLRIVWLYTSLTSYIQQQNLLWFPWVDAIADYVKVKVKRKESNIYHCK